MSNYAMEGHRKEISKNLGLFEVITPELEKKSLKAVRHSGEDG